MKLRALAAVVVLTATPPLLGQEPQSQDAAPAPAPRRFRLGAEVKAHFRHSAFEEVRVGFPFPPSFLPAGETAVFERTVAQGSSFEVSNVALTGDADFAPHLKSRVAVHFLDLYNRNPTSSDDRVQLREGWIRFGRKAEPMDSAAGSRFYAQLGKSPRFSKQRTRRLESYGLWGTAVGRLEELQLELGGELGGRAYFRAQLGNGNPLFFRDPNALAGDNGTPERVPQPGPRPITGIQPVHQSGFPLLYDGKASDLNLNDSFQFGLGLGVRGRSVEKKRAGDALFWYFQRRLAEAPQIRGTFYRGDLTLLRGVLFPLPFSGDRKRELGVNLVGELRGARLWAQYVNQDIAGLERSGVEIELSYLFELDGKWLSGETPVLNWIMPTLRYSSIANDFTAPAQSPAPSLAFDWKKLDLGLRVGIVPGLDFTAEYSRHDMVVPPTLHPDEWLFTLRAAFD